MIAKCIKCGKQFQQKYSERHCGSHSLDYNKDKLETLREKRKYYNDLNGTSFLLLLRSNVQNPIHQVKETPWIFNMIPEMKTYVEPRGWKARKSVLTIKC